MKRLISFFMILVLFCSLFIVNAENFEIFGSEMSGYRGDEVELTVCVKNNPGTVAFRIGISWKNATMTLIPGSVAYSAGFSTGTSVENEKLDGKLYTAWISTKNNDSDGEIFTVRFKICDKASIGTHPVSISVSSYTDENGVKHQPMILDGSVRVKKRSSGGFSQGTIVDDPEDDKTADTYDDCGEKNDDTAFVNPFSDVAANAYYYEAVKWAVEKKITSGVTDEMFCPEAMCTRAQAVTFLYRFAGNEDTKNNSIVFSDVDEKSYYYSPVAWAVSNSVTSGTSEDSFSPDSFVTRGQFLTFLWRLAGKPVVERNVSFNDILVDSYYYSAVLWAFENNITRGTGETTFSPDDLCTRGQIVTFLNRYSDIIS